MKIIDGKKLSEEMKLKIREKLQDEKYKTISSPHLIIIQVGDNDTSNFCIDDKKKACDEVGIRCSVYKYENINTKRLKRIVSELSLNPLVTGISIQLPLPKYIDTNVIIDEIDPIKDVDGITCVQAGMLQLGIKNKYRLEPCTAKGIIKLLEDKTDLEGKSITVVGRSNDIGKPVSQLLQEKNATITLCHTRTSISDLENNIRNSDIVILATNRAKYFTSRYFYAPETNKYKIIIDAGINRNNNGKLCGDLDVEDLNKIYNSSNFYYTSVSEGLGPMTIIGLLENICTAYDAQFDNIWKYHRMKKL